MHTDAVQSVGRFQWMCRPHCGHLSVSSHKILTERGRMPYFGGHQTETAHFGAATSTAQSGTENVWVLLGLVRQCDWQWRFRDNVRIQRLRDQLIDAVLREYPTLGSMVERSTVFRTTPISASATSRGVSRVPLERKGDCWIHWFACSSRA